MGDTPGPTWWRGRVRGAHGRTYSTASLLRGPVPGAEDGTGAVSPAGATFAAARLRDAAPRLAAPLTLAAGVLNLGSALLPAERQRLDLLHRLVPGALSRGATVATAATGVGLLRGSAILHLLKGLDFEEAVAEAFLAGLLAGQGRSFRSRAGPSERRATAAAALGVIGITAAYGIVGLLVNGRDVVEDLSAGRVLGEVGRMALGLGSTLTLTRRFGRFFPTSVAAVFWLGMLVVAARAL